MSELAKRPLGVVSTATWAGLLGRAGLAGLIAFVVLQSKEFVDAGRLDTSGTGADALLIAAGTLLVYGVLKLVK